LLFDNSFLGRRFGGAIAYQDLGGVVEEPDEESSDTVEGGGGDMLAG